jgi:hypothetical protein
MIVLRFMSRLFSALAQRPLTAAILARLVAWWLARRAIPIGPLAGGGAAVLFGLSRVRIFPDAAALADAGEFTILTLPDNDQFLLKAPFFRGRDDPSVDSTGSPIAAANRERYRAFLTRMLPQFLGRIGADAVIGAHFVYAQDVDWGAVAQQAGFPYIVLFRESLKISGPERAALIEMCRRLGQFEGEKILTGNEIARDCILTAGFAGPEQVQTTGTVRLSKFIALCRRGTPPQPPGVPPTATLFSFNPGSSLNGLGLHPWPSNPYSGWVRLFERTHSAFAAAAFAAPNARFVIKSKWGGMWLARIREALLSRGIDVDTLPNLEISAVKNANDLILESTLVVGFTSTTLLEAGLAGRRILIPDFDESLDPYYENHIKLKEIYPFVEVARSPDDVTRCTVAALENPGFLSTSAKRELTHYFSVFVSPASQDPMRETAARIRDAIARLVPIRVAK